MTKQFRCRLCEEPSEFGLCEKHSKMTHNLAEIFAPKGYVHETIALGWFIADATKGITEEDMKAIEKDND